MGFFSWRSCVSGHDIMNEYSELHEGITVVLPDDRVLTGVYDGYGRVQGEDIYDEIAGFMFGKKDRDILFSTEGAFEKAQKLIKVMLPKEYREDMRYADLKSSKHAEGQGHWLSSYETRFNRESNQNPDNFKSNYNPY